MSQSAHTQEDTSWPAHCGTQAASGCSGTGCWSTPSTTGPQNSRAASDFAFLPLGFLLGLLVLLGILCKHGHRLSPGGKKKSSARWSNNSNELRRNTLRFSASDVLMDAKQVSWGGKLQMQQWKEFKLCCVGGTTAAPHVGNSSKVHLKWSALIRLRRGIWTRAVPIWYPYFNLEYQPIPISIRY